MITIDVTAHYEQYKPEVCTYTCVACFESIYVVTTVIGLFGGLFLILRLSIPFVIKITMQEVERRQTFQIRRANPTTSKLNRT